MKINLEAIYDKLASEVAKGYKINELIPFSYPVRRITVRLQANKRPDASLAQVYRVILRTIATGLTSIAEVFEFLGISERDEFMQREILLMRELELLEFLGEKVVLTEKGKEFLKNNDFLRVIETDDFPLLVDGISGGLISCLNVATMDEPLAKSLPSNLKFPIKSPELIAGKYDALADIYKSDNSGSAYLIAYRDEDVQRDFSEWLNLLLIEYVPIGSKKEPVIEIRRLDDNLSKVQSLSKLFNQDYRHFLYHLSDSERTEFDDEIALSHPSFIQENKADDVAGEEIVNLGIWETQHEFKKLLADAKQKVLIESPWVKRGTRQYLDSFANLAKRGVKVYILFGIDENTEHDFRTLDDLRKLAERHPNEIKLIDLPAHFRTLGNRQRHGTHRKLVIKDDDLYISGSFNFLSFNQKKGSSVANEESHLIRRGAKNKWVTVVKEYSLEAIVVL